MNFYQIFLAPLIEQDYLQKAFLACLAISFSGAILGVFLILRRMTLVGDAMSHAILPGVAIAFFFFGSSTFAMTLGGIIAGLFIAIFGASISRLTQLKEDASFSAIYLISLAVGVMIISIKGNSIDLTHILFGDILSLDKSSLTLLIFISIFSLVILKIIYRALIIECFDPIFMKVISGKGALIHQIFLILLVLNLVCAFRTFGILMTLGIMLIPAITACLLSKKINQIIIFTILIAIFSSYFGLLFSYHYSAPTGPSIVISSGIFYILAILFGKNNGLAYIFLRKKHYIT